LKKEFDVICIGAALVDMIARVERHPEKDDEVFVSELKLLSGGAAANTAYACGRLGLKTAFIGKLGENDAFKNKILDDFRIGNVETRFIKYSKEKGTGSAYVALNPEGERRIYAHSGAANLLSENEILEKELISTRVIFLSSLKNIKPFIKAGKIGKKFNIPVILNPGMLIIDQGINNIKVLLEHIDILILSRKEFSTLFRTSINYKNVDLVREYADKLLSLGVRVIIITLGEKGALLITKEMSELIDPYPVDEVIDTTGAGDSFSAGFILGFTKSLDFDFNPLRSYVRLGNFVASRCIRKLGARNGIPNYEELKELYYS